MTAGGIAPDGAGGRTTADLLERRYRWLLLAYPHSYRRHHGTEILTTLMDAAGPGRDRPTRREVRDLVIGGLRQRFRLPVGRVMVLVAVVSALIFGALGSAAGSALGWVTAAPPPGTAALGDFAFVTVGQPVRWDAESEPSAFGLRSRTVAGTVLPWGWGVEEARSRLAADGWRVGPVERRPVAITKEDGSVVTATDVAYVAEKDGVEIMVSVVEEPGHESYGVVLAQGAEPWSVLPLTLAGLLGGLLAGWLLAARIGYRVRRLSPWGQVPYAIVAGVTAFALGVSAPATFYWVGQMIKSAVSPDPIGPGRFGQGAAFSVHAVDSPQEWLTVLGFGTLMLLVALAYAVPAKTARSERAITAMP